MLLWDYENYDFDAALSNALPVFHLIVINNNAGWQLEGYIFHLETVYTYAIHLHRK